MQKNANEFTRVQVEIDRVAQRLIDPLVQASQPLKRAFEELNKVGEETIKTLLKIQRPDFSGDSNAEIHE